MIEKKDYSNLDAPEDFLNPGKDPLISKKNPTFKDGLQPCKVVIYTKHHKTKEGLLHVWLLLEGGCFGRGVGKATLQPVILLARVP